MTQRLAARTDIRLGDVIIRPATREVVGPTARETLEPKVMAVLVVLLDAGGALVTRDALIAACWDGRIVGDDAVTRVISRLRRLAAGAAAGAFTIDTISKAGYRLTIDPGRTVSGAAPAAAVPRPFRTFAATAVAVLAVAGIGGWWSHRAPRVPAAVVAAPDRDPAAHDLEARGRALVFEGSRDATRHGIDYLREAARHDPANAEAWGGLALGHVRSLLHTPAADQPAAILRVRDAAAQAFARDPREALATAAIVSLAPTYGHWAQKDAALQAALASARGNRTAILFQRAQFLAAVGRTREALAFTEAAAAISPLLPWIQAMRIDLLASEGRLEAADEAAARAGRLWPRDPRLWLVRFDLKAFGGRPAEAAAMAADGSGWPDAIDPADLRRAEAVARALASGSAAAAVVAAERVRVDSDPGYGEQALRMTAALAHDDAAFALIDRAYLSHAPAPGPSRFDYIIGRIAPGERNTVGLFVAPTVRLAGDPRFLAALARIGLVDFWRRTRAPDFCRRPPAAAACARYGLPTAVVRR